MTRQMWMQIVAACSLAALVALFSTRRADAGVIYDNIAPRSSDWVYGETNDLLAQPFVLDSSTTVASAKLQLVRYHTSVSGTLDVQIWDDDGGGRPGKPVGTLGTIDADLGLGNWDYYVPAYLTLTFDDPVAGLNPGSTYHLVLSFLNATTLGAQSQVGWTMVRPSAGTNGAGEALGRGESSGPQWVNISSFVHNETYNYFQMTLTGVPEPSSLTAAVCAAGLIGASLRPRATR